MQNKFATVLNLSNQANLIQADKTKLSQFNLVVMLGLRYLSNRIQINNKVPVSINVRKTGEIELTSIDGDIINDEGNARIYTDKRITTSEDSMEGDEVNGSSS
ncbi:MAG: hypothetical protein AB1420_07055 [Bacillota bacterium]